MLPGSLKNQTADKVVPRLQHTVFFNSSHMHLATHVRDPVKILLT